MDGFRNFKRISKNEKWRTIWKDVNDLLLAGFKGGIIVVIDHHDRGERLKQ